MPLAYAKNGKIRTNHTKISDDGTYVTVVLYNTLIFSWNKSLPYCIVDCGDFRTPTTFRRINECLHFYGFNGRRLGNRDFAADTKVVYCKDGTNCPLTTFNRILHHAHVPK